MICRPLPSKVSDWIAPRERPFRTAGWHVSTVLVAMLKQANPKKYATWGQRTEPRKPTDEIGYMWEDVLSAPLAARILVPPGCIALPSVEMALDNIYATPDRPLFDTAARRFQVGEAKATWMTCKLVVDEHHVPLETFRTDPKFTYWRLQTCTYCAMIWQLLPRPTFQGLPIEWLRLIDGSVDLTATPIGHIRSLFLNGRQRGDFAIPAGWELEWTADELNRWWVAVRTFAHAHPELKTEGDDLA